MLNKAWRPFRTERRGVGLDRRLPVCSRALRRPGAHSVECRIGSALAARGLLVFRAQRVSDHSDLERDLWLRAGRFPDFLDQPLSGLYPAYFIAFSLIVHFGVERRIDALRTAIKERPWRRPAWARGQRAEPTPGPLPAAE